MLFHEIVTQVNDDGEPIGGFLIPGNVPIQKVWQMIEGAETLFGFPVVQIDSEELVSCKIILRYIDWLEGG